MKHQARNEKKTWYNSVPPVYFDYRTGKKKFHPHQINDFIVGSIAKCFMVSSPVDRAPRRFHNKRRRRKKKVVDATEFLLFSSSTDGDGDLFMHLRNEGKKKKGSRNGNDFIFSKWRRLVVGPVARQHHNEKGLGRINNSHRTTQ